MTAHASQHTYGSSALHECVFESILLLLSSRSVWVEGWTQDGVCRWLLTQAPSPIVTGWWPVAQTSGRVQQRGTWHSVINKWGLPLYLSSVVLLCGSVSIFRTHERRVLHSAVEALTEGRRCFLNIRRAADELHYRDPVSSIARVMTTGASLWQ